MGKETSARGNAELINHEKCGASCRRRAIPFGRAQCKSFPNSASGAQSCPVVEGGFGAETTTGQSCDPAESERGFLECRASVRQMRLAQTGRAVFDILFAIGTVCRVTPGEWRRFFSSALHPSANPSTLPSGCSRSNIPNTDGNKPLAFGLGLWYMHRPLRFRAGGAGSTVRRILTNLEIMSQHRSLRAAATLGGKRNVLKRFERTELLKKRGQWKDGDRITGLRKTKPEA